MTKYAFMAPVKADKMADWRRYIGEIKGARHAELKESRDKMGLSREEVWLQHTPMGDFAVVYWEAPDIGKVFKQMMSSDAPFDKWFRDHVLVEVHGMDPGAPPPPMNEAILT